jgi:hypothetical protein
VSERVASLLREARAVELGTRRHLAASRRIGAHRSFARGVGIEFEEVREYVPGDDPRSVDQNVTARYGRPFVKRFVEERGLEVLVVLDRGLGLVAATAARLVACLGVSAVRGDDEIGLCLAGAHAIDEDEARGVGERPGIEVPSGVVSGRPPVVVGPVRKGMPHVANAVARSLAHATRPAGAADARAEGLVDAIEAVTRRAGRRGPALVFVVSDWLMPLSVLRADGHGGRLASALARLALRHDALLVRLDRRDLELPPREVGVVRMRAPGAARGRLVDWRCEPVRNAFRARVARWHEALVELRARSGVVELRIPPLDAGAEGAGELARVVQATLTGRGRGGGR